MIWLIIFLVLAVALGPVMYLLPNAKDKRLTALRAQARQLGLSVKITSLPKLDPAAQERVTAGGETLEPRTQCTVYKIPIGQQLQGVEALLLLKLPDAPTVGFNEVAPGFALHEDSSLAFWQIYGTSRQPTRAASPNRLLAAFAELPSDTLALAIDERFVSCYWLEKAPPESQVVDKIHGVLMALGEDLCTRFGTASQ